jgi:hypothetical protein
MNSTPSRVSILIVLAASLTLTACDRKGRAPFAPTPATETPTTPTTVAPSTPEAPFVNPIVPPAAGSRRLSPNPEESEWIQDTIDAPAKHDIVCFSGTAAAPDGEIAIRYPQSSNRSARYSIDYTATGFTAGMFNHDPKASGYDIGFIRQKREGSNLYSEAVWLGVSSAPETQIDYLDGSGVTVFEVGGRKEGASTRVLIPGKAPVATWKFRLDSKFEKSVTCVILSDKSTQSGVAGVTFEILSKAQLLEILADEGLNNQLR